MWEPHPQTTVTESMEVGRTSGPGRGEVVCSGDPPVRNQQSWPVKAFTPLHFARPSSPTAPSSTVLINEPFSRVQRMQRCVRLFPLLIYLLNVCCGSVAARHCPGYWGQRDKETGSSQQADPDHILGPLDMRENVQRPEVLKQADIPGVALRS